MLQCTARCSLMHYMTSRTSGFRPSVRLSHEQLTRDSIYTCIANMLSSVHPSLTHVHQSNTVKFRQWECITNIRLSISHTVDITFTACRQHVSIATTLVISGSTTDSSKLCQIAMKLLARDSTQHMQSALASLH